jgi:hypothetical protein
MKAFADTNVLVHALAAVKLFAALPVVALPPQAMGATNTSSKR